MVRGGCRAHSVAMVRAKGNVNTICHSVDLVFSVRGGVVRSRGSYRARRVGLGHDRAHRVGLGHDREAHNHAQVCRYHGEIRC